MFSGFVAKLGKEVMKMDKQTRQAWNRFLYSGEVKDYLRYKELLYGQNHQDHRDHHQEREL